MYNNQDKHNLKMNADIIASTFRSLKREIRSVSLREGLNGKKSLHIYSILYSIYNIFSSKLKENVFFFIEAFPNDENDELQLS